MASITPDNTRLRGFDKVELKSGKKKTVTFNIPAHDLAFMNTKNKWCIEKGTYKVQVDGQTLDIECTEKKLGKI